MAAGIDFDGLLNAFMGSDNGVRRQAEAAWEDMKRQHPDEVLEKMCGVLARRDAGSEGLRAMAAVLLRTLFDVRSDLWFRTQPLTKAGVKAALLASLTDEPMAHIRRKLTHSVGHLAGKSSSESEWPELMALTVSLCSAAQPYPELKVVGLDLVNILAEFCLDSLSPHQVGLLQMFDTCLEDAHMDVRVAALKAVCSFLQDALTGSSPLPEESLMLKSMSVLEATVIAGNEDAARDVLEALNVVAAKQPQLVVQGRCLDMVGKAMLSLAASPALELSTRELSLEFITSLCESAPAVMRERGVAIVQEVVPLTVHMLTQQADDSDEALGVWLAMADGMGGGEDDGEEVELAQVAASALSRIAIALGGKAVLSSALPLCSELLADASDWRRRKAGLLTLLLTGEGCGQELAESGLLPQIVLGPVQAGIADAHPRVRYAALTCLGQMTEDYADWEGSGGGGDGGDEDGEGGEGSFQGEFHAQLLPLLVQSLGGANADKPRLLAAALGAVISFCNPTRMQPEWLCARYRGGGAGDGAVGHALLEALSVILVNGCSSMEVQEEAFTAVGCVAQVLRGGFGPFYGTFVPLAKEVLIATSPMRDGNGQGAVGVAAVQSTDTLRGKAMEAIALMGGAVGVSAFRADAHQVIRILISEQKTVSRDPGNPQSTYALQALARIAGVLREEFLPYLDDAVEPLLSALSMDAEIKVSSAPNMATAKEEMEAAGLTALEMDLRGVGKQLFGVNTSLMQAKESACKTLYQYTEDLGEGFTPHAARTLAVVLPNLGQCNAVAVQVVSAAIVPKLVGMASRRAAVSPGGGGGGAGGGTTNPALVAEAQAMLDASVDALCEVVFRISGERGQGAGEVGDMEPACLAADSLSTLLGHHCKLEDPSPLVVGDKELTMSVKVLRDAAAASMRRSEARVAGTGGRSEAGHHPLAGMTGAVDSTDLDEQEEWEEDLLTSAVDGIGWLIKGRREAFLPIFESELKPFVLPLLAPLPSMPPSQRSFGLCMCIDVLEHCGDGGRLSVFPTLLPALMRGCREEVSSTMQACAYGLGVAADVGGSEFDARSPEALQLLLALVAGGRDSDDEGGFEAASVRDNAVSAAFRLIFARRAPLTASLSGRGYNAGDDDSASSAHLGPTLRTLLGELPLATDVAEGRDCNRRIVDRAAAGDKLLLGGGGGHHVVELLSAMAGMMVYQRSSQEEEESAAGEGSFGRTETESAMWARQLVDRETREKAEKAVMSLRIASPAAFEASWEALDAEKRSALQTPTSSIHPHGSLHHIQLAR